ncbi:MAG: diaminopimelate epimerase [Bdellovibrionales bacterium]
MKLLKVEATGNDFIVNVLAPGEAVPKDSKLSSLAVQLCERKRSIGADGFIVLNKKDNINIDWYFYNSDGSSAEMCGNAARAITKLAVEKLGMEKKISLHTLSGPVSLEYLSESEFKIGMSKKDLVAETDAYRIWDTGVPHLVQESIWQMSDDFRQVARELRFPEELDSKGANVSFWYSSKDKIKGISFERGVEDFTLACGTGACALALDYFSRTGEDAVAVEVPGGTLRVEMSGEDLFLIGPAKVVATLEVEI